MTPRIAITLGEPAGIGPELVAQLAHRDYEAELVVLGDPDLLRERARAIGVALDLEPYVASTAPRARSKAGTLSIEAITLARPARAGVLDPGNAAAVVASLERASTGCLSGEFDAVVTAPVQKSVINDGGVPFVGHTEFFAERAGREVTMLLAAGDLRVALATTHLPLARVAAAIEARGVRRHLRTLDTALRNAFGITRPRIAVLGLNPHAGEAGHLGREEIEIITPVLDSLRAEGLDLTGPLPADTAFLPAQRARFDAYLAMYHDQALPVLKALGFGASVNVTLGLPYPRTSVDHGTALDLAGSGRAEPDSLFAATALAIDLGRRARARRG